MLYSLKVGLAECHSTNCELEGRKPRFNHQQPEGYYPNLSLGLQWGEFNLHSNFSTFRNKCCVLEMKSDVELLCRVLHICATYQLFSSTQHLRIEMPDSAPSTD